MAVQVGKLEGLVIDQDQHQFLRGQKGVQAVLDRGCLGHVRHSLRFFAVDNDDEFA